MGFEMAEHRAGFGDACTETQDCSETDKLSRERSPIEDGVFTHRKY